MSDILKEILSANQKYTQQFGEKGKRALPPARHFAILTCMDARLETAALGKDGFHDVDKGPGSRAGEFIEWLAFSDPDQAVIDDVARIRNHPLVPSTIPVYGYIYDVKTGKLNEVHEATKIGKAHAAK